MSEVLHCSYKVPGNRKGKIIASGDLGKYTRYPEFCKDVHCPYEKHGDIGLFDCFLIKDSKGFRCATNDNDYDFELCEFIELNGDIKLSDDNEPYDCELIVIICAKLKHLK